LIHPTKREIRRFDDRKPPRGGKAACPLVAGSVRLPAVRPRRYGKRQPEPQWQASACPAVIYGFCANLSASKIYAKKKGARAKSREAALGLPPLSPPSQARGGKHLLRVVKPKKREKPALKTRKKAEP